MSATSDVGPSQEGENYEEDIFKVPLLPGGNPLPIPEEGEIGWGSAPTFEPWEDTGWEADESQRLRISNNCMTATAMLEMTCVAVMGERTFSTGLHAWTVIIEVGAASLPALASLSSLLSRVHLHLLPSSPRAPLPSPAPAPPRRHPAPHPARASPHLTAPPHRHSRPPPPCPPPPPPLPPNTPLHLLSL